MIFINNFDYKITTNKMKFSFLLLSLLSISSSASFLRGANDYIPINTEETFFISYNKEGIRKDVKYENGNFTLVQ